jgi:ABC-type lipoprotein release transport system permease subunit
MAWRNLWRNKKRTFITLAAVVMAVFLSTFMSSMQEGTYSSMIDNVVQFYSGYIQVHDSNYWESRSVNDLYTPDTNMYSTIASVEGITNFTPRLESFTLISTGEQTKGSALIGIDPHKEDQITELSKWVKKGEFLTPADDGVLLPINLAKNLKAELGDTMVLFSQGYRGATAAGLFPVRGILEFPSPDLNNMAAYVSLQQAQWFYAAPGMISAMVIMVDDYEEVKPIKEQLNADLDNKYEAMTWEEMQPELVQLIEGDRAGGVIMKAILYVLVGFGIFGTVIMMMNERMKEIAITIAVGMQKAKVELMLFLETFYIGFLGVLAGFVLSLPIMIYFLHNPVPLPGEAAAAYEAYGLEPVMYFSLTPTVFINQVLTVFIITVIIALYPILRVQYFNLIKALRS